MGQTTGAHEELTRVTAAYQAIRPPFLVRATVHRRTSQGERWQEVHREYRVAESGGVARVDAGTAGQRPGVTIIRKGNSLTLFLAEPNASTELAVQAEEARPIHEAIGRAYTSVFGRFANLDVASASVVSSRVKLKSSSGAASRWEGEL